MKPIIEVHQEEWKDMKDRQVRYQIVEDRIPEACKKRPEPCPEIYYNDLNEEIDRLRRTYDPARSRLSDGDISFKSQSETLDVFALAVDFIGKPLEYPKGVLSEWQYKGAGISRQRKLLYNVDENYLMRYAASIRRVGEVNDDEEPDKDSESEDGDSEDGDSEPAPDITKQLEKLHGYGPSVEIWALAEAWASDLMNLAEVI